MWSGVCLAVVLELQTARLTGASDSLCDQVGCASRCAGGIDDVMNWLARVPRDRRADVTFLVCNERVTAPRACGHGIGETVRAQAERLSHPHRGQTRDRDEGDGRNRDRYDYGESAAPIRRTRTVPSAVLLQPVEAIELPQATLDLTSLPTLLT